MIAEPPATDLRVLGMQDYLETWQRMRRFTDERGEHTADALWVVEHPPVYTQGQAGRDEHLLSPGNVPVVRTDRGGQVTYHGPGQSVVYVLLDLRRLGVGVKTLVRGLESAVIHLVAAHGISATRRAGAPGVYVGQAKLAAVGLRVRRGCTYHGVALNVDMDLGPFLGINPCGYEGMVVTQLRDLGVELGVTEVGIGLATGIGRELGLSTRLAAGQGHGPFVGLPAC